MVDAVLEAAQPSPGDLMVALALIVELRTDTDRAERQLISRAREQGISWSRIAEALALRSRQAAEQRWRRLRAAGQTDPTEPGRAMRQQFIDDVGSDALSLRYRVVALHDRLARQVAADDLRSHRGASFLAFARIGLAVRTLALAAVAPPGALHDLASLAVTDLRRIPDSTFGHAIVECIDDLASALGQNLSRPSSSLP